MRSRRRLAASCLLLAALAGTPAAALAQSSPDQGGVTADGVVVPPATSTDNGLPATTPATDDAQPINPELTAPTETSPVPATTTPESTTPVPPGYLTPGAYASVQPVAGVATLKDPDIPFEPVRIAALIAAFLGAVLITAAVLSRTLGLRTAVGAPGAPPPGGRRARRRRRRGRRAAAGPALRRPAR
ncbi:MAG: hypothetical protein REI11_07210 [Patulibacter sp.]|nr:hypothetical protein [Patulibacter sp.]